MKCQFCRSKGTLNGCPICRKKLQTKTLQAKTKEHIIGELIIMDKYQFVQGHLIAEIVKDVMKLQKGEV